MILQSSDDVLNLYLYLYGFCERTYTIYLNTFTKPEMYLYTLKETNTRNVLYLSVLLSNS